MPWTITIALFFVAAALLGWGRLRRGPIAVAAMPFVVQLAAIAAEALRSVPARTETIDWIPSLGVRIGFLVDPLTLILSAVVSGIGLLIVAYSAGYFPLMERRRQFLALLALFAGGMAGLVASRELFGLFVFWEITTVASYLLIGFDDEKARNRAAALEALLVTTAGGLAMLAGFVLLAITGGTTSIPELVSDPPQGTMATMALVLVFAGAFTKSAQVPFHFWLPEAMAAPTPASAYLHSATMVKAGVVLLLFLAPGFATAWLWTPVVTGIGLVTMALGAVLALRQTDLKLLLAYGTVSQLGLMVALVGLDLIAPALAVLLAHAVFKAALFLVVGTVEKATGRRDLRELSAVGRALPALAIAGALAALSMAGVPPLLGFVTKEAAFDALIVADAWLPLVVIAASSVLSVAYSARFWWGAFATKRRLDATEVAPTRAVLTAMPGILAVVTVLMAMVPGWLAAAVGEATGRAVKLVLWPGLVPAFGVSVAVMVAGFVAFAILIRRGVGHPPHRLPPMVAAYQFSLRALNRVADVVTGVLQNGSLPVYLAVTLTAVLAVPAVVWLASAQVTASPPLTNNIAELTLGAVVITAAVAATRAQRRMAAALLLGLAGYGVAGLYVAFSAPDLALTQLLIETLTIALFAFVLARLPRRFGADPGSLSRSVRVGVALFVGAFMAVAAVFATSVDPARSVAEAYVEEAVNAGGRNVVNVVLTNFRALDTLGEIAVLAAAGLGITALIVSRSRRSQPESS